MSPAASWALVLAILVVGGLLAWIGGELLARWLEP